MSKAVEIPGLSPLIIVRNSLEALQWYKQVFGAREKFRLTDRAGSIVHTEAEINGALLMLADEQGDFNNTPEKLGGSAVVLHLRLENVDEVFQKALKAGATEIFPLADQFYGERAGRFKDPFGHMWILSKSIENVSPEEMQRRMDQM